MNRSSPAKSGQDRHQLAQRVGRQIREERLGRGLTQRELGRTIGVSGQQIEKYEKGMDTIPLHRLFTLAQLFRRTPESFWTDTAVHLSSAAGGEADRSTLQAMRAYQRIGNPELRKRLLQLMKQMAGEGDAGDD